ncbi:MAG TPA: 4-hydroxy-2-oxovalerate aldolase [Clostridia bacterium]|nr:4-hydroxy-2-oxovalerate aldolase [Clostridia bacterium]
MNNLMLMDCTLRDGANVVGKGFSAELTTMMIEGLIRSHIKTIEMGNAYGLGAYEANGFIAPLTDVAYLELVQPYLNKADIGMFIGVKNANEKNIALAAQYGLKFLRIGANAGDGTAALKGIELVKQYGMTCRYSLMKAYVLSLEELAQEAKMLAAAGLDEITIMDSAGTMLPDEAEAYARALSSVLSIPVAFHGHNNLGLSVANALAAVRGGATVLDCGLMGMARSAGNCATELAAAVFQRRGQLGYVDLFALLHFIEQELEPAMAKDYACPVKPLDLVFGLYGCHSNFYDVFAKVAAEKNVSLYRLIAETCKIDRKSPPKALIEQVADGL